MCQRYSFIDPALAVELELARTGDLLVRSASSSRSTLLALVKVIPGASSLGPQSSNQLPSSRVTLVQFESPFSIPRSPRRAGAGLCLPPPHRQRSADHPSARLTTAEDRRLGPLAGLSPCLSRFRPASLGVAAQPSTTTAPYLPPFRVRRPQCHLPQRVRVRTRCLPGWRSTSIGANGGSTYVQLSLRLCRGGTEGVELNFGPTSSC